MNSVVMDASISLEWFLTEPNSATPAWDKVAILDTYVPVVPAIWYLEVTNTLAMYVRRNLISKETAQIMFSEMKSLPMAAVNDGIPTRVMDLALAEGLTTYDAAYLDVAMRGNWPLLTLDAQLSRAAASVGVQTL